MTAAALLVAMHGVSPDADGARSVEEYWREFAQRHPHAYTILVARGGGRVSLGAEAAAHMPRGPAAPRPRAVIVPPVLGAPVPAVPAQSFEPFPFIVPLDHRGMVWLSDQSVYALEPTTSTTRSYGLVRQLDIEPLIRPLRLRPALGAPVPPAPPDTPATPVTPGQPSTPQEILTPQGPEEPGPPEPPGPPTPTPTGPPTPTPTGPPTPTPTGPPTPTPTGPPTPTPTGPPTPTPTEPPFQRGNNGVGNGLDPQPPGNPPINDGPGTGPGFPGNQGGTPGQGLGNIFGGPPGLGGGLPPGQGGPGPGQGNGPNLQDVFRTR